MKNLKDLVQKVFSGIHHDEKLVEDLVSKYEEKARRKISNIINSLAVEQSGFLIEKIPPQGIKIDKPGTYYLNNDIVWMPGAQDKGVAIDIECDHVVLDLNGHKITAMPTSNLQDIVGIQVGGSLFGRNNISIQNGELVNMSFHGISVALTNQLNIFNVKVCGSDYTYFGSDYLVTASAIYVEFSNYINISQCTVEAVSVTAPAYAGIQLFASINGSITNCKANDLVNKDGTVTGFSCVEGCKHIVTLNCQASRFQSFYHGNPLGKTTTLGHTVLGFLPTECSFLYYIDCSATDLKGCCDDCHGMSIFDSNDVTVTRFKALGILDGDAPVNTGAKATGLEVYGNRILVKDCLVENIFAIVPQDKQSCGFSAAGNDITFESCIAKNVLVWDETRNPTDKFEKYGYGMGFGWAPDPRKPFVDMYAVEAKYLNCKAVACQVGFDTWNHQSGRWDNWSVENCKINVLQQPGSTRIFSMNDCSELPPGMESPITIENHATNNVFNPKMV